MHALSAAVFSLLLLTPSGQLFGGLRQPLRNLFGPRGGDPDADGARTEQRDDPLPDMISHTNHAPAVLYRRMPSVVIEPEARLADFYSRRPPAHWPGSHAAGLPAVGSRWRPQSDYGSLEGRFAGKAESSTEDRIIEALKLFKQLRTMAT